MADSVVNASAMETGHESYRARMFFSFFAVYVIWGTTFLAIRIAVEELPPLFAAAARFFIAGIVLYAFMRFKGETAPTSRQWRNLSIVALFLFVAEYAPLFWAEKSVPSGVVSVLAATIPILTLVAEAVILREKHLKPGIIFATLIGFSGVVILLLRGADRNFALVPCIAVLLGSICWAVGSVFNRSMDLPKSRPVTAGATMMLGGIGLFALSAGFGELHPLPHISLRAVWALLYLIVFGSLIAFTAFVWLISHMSASRVSSYAYVNPVIAIAIGYFWAGEPLTPRIIAGTALVLISVFLILRQK
jgi:drug/metabolite transporter (DMT)-like permease